MAVVNPSCETFSGRSSEKDLRLLYGKVEFVFFQFKNYIKPRKILLFFIKLKNNRFSVEGLVVGL